jgi:hypothetical protein
MGVLDISSKGKAKDRSVKFPDAHAVPVDDYQTPRAPSQKSMQFDGKEEFDAPLSMLGKIRLGLRIIGSIVSFMALMG